MYADGSSTISTGSLTTARHDFQAVLLNDDNVLVAGELDGLAAAAAAAC
jgi:hypothetical protein